MMKKYIVLLSCIIFATVTNAQGVVKAGKFLQESAKGTTPKAPIVKQPHIKPIPNEAIVGRAEAALNATRTGVPKMNTGAPSKAGKADAKSPPE